ncbi:MAG: hypothetical protein Q8M16_05490 [Pirellulaceae bacterium]|nr:hypothetical protein [Pirellulaceae bacterium]
MSDDLNFVNSIQVVLSRVTELLKDREFRVSLRTLANLVLQVIPDEAAQKPEGGKARTFESATPESVLGNSVSQELFTSLQSFGTQIHPNEEIGLNSLSLASDGKSDVVGCEEPSPPSAPELPGSRSDAERQVLSAREAVQLLHFGRGNLSKTETSVGVSYNAELVGTEQRAAGDVEFANDVKQRCQLKAEAARWAAERRRLLQIGADFRLEIDPVDRDLIARAREIPNCFLWTNSKGCPEPAEVARFDELADNFDNLAASMALVETIFNDGALDASLHDVLLLVAEAQSALRQAVRQTGYDGYDSDQNATYSWLRETSRRAAVYIERFMKTEDIAEPHASDELAARIARADQDLQRKVSRQKDVRRMLNKVRFESRLIQEQGEQDATTRINTILRAVSELVPTMLQPSNVELREHLIPILHHFDTFDDTEHSATLVLREIERYLARNPGVQLVSDQVVRYSAEVIQLRELLRGKSLLMVGGELRQDRQAALRLAFELKELYWETVLPHTPLREFEPKIARPDVVAVLLAIRWSSHCYTDLEQFCRHCRKPLVRLPGGTNANQIAHQFMIQATQRLANGIEPADQKI